MASGTIKTTKIDELKFDANGAVIAECFTIDFEKTPERRFDEKNLAGIERALADFAQDLANEPHCYRLRVRLDAGVRAPDGFNRLSNMRNSSLNMRINTEKAKTREHA